MRQYAGFGTAAESNARYKQLIANGTTGLSVAFDLRAQMGYEDSTPRSRARSPVKSASRSTRSTNARPVRRHPAGQVSTSMTITPGRAALLL